MQDIIDKYAMKETPYLLPIIKNREKSEREHYLCTVHLVNRKLKKTGKRLDLLTPLAMYVARHSWASIAKSKNIPISIISESMGHDSEITTQIYLASLDMAAVDKANNLILKAL